MKFIYGSEKDFIEFVSGIEDKDRVAVFTHNDLDGIVSAIFIEKILGRLESLDFVWYTKEMLEKRIENLKKKRINKVIFLDLCLEFEEKEIKEIEKFADVLIIDHHKWNKDLSSEKTKLILTYQENIPSFVCYNFCNKIQNFQNLDFLVAIALISDYVFIYDKAREFIKKVENKYNLRKNKDVKKSELWELTLKLNSSNIYFKNKKDGMKRIYNMIKKIKKIHDFSQFDKCDRIIKKEFERLERDFKKNREVYDWGYIYYVRSKFKMGSPFSTKMSEEEKDKLYIILAEGSDKNIIEVSARNQSREYNCAEILKRAVEKLERGHGGGHIPAAGAQFLKKDLKKFRENLLRILN